jgi:hypothetical protein
MENQLSPAIGAIRDTAQITAIGHRAVHGGSTFVQSVVASDDVMTELRACSAFAPLYNPCNIAGIEEAMRLFPGTPNVVVFDTAFHQTMPPHAHLYALPYELCAVAVDVFVYQVRKQIGAYAAAMNGWMRWSSPPASVKTAPKSVRASARALVSWAFPSIKPQMTSSTREIPTSAPPMPVSRRSWFRPMKN